MAQISPTFIKEVENKSESAVEYTAPELQADTLFNFVDNIEYIIKPLQNKMLSPRYCVEPIQYMHLTGIERIAFPMKCFCDINFHRLSSHLGWYGYYGLAFKKEWGIRKGIQPVQYINEESEQRRDFTTVFNMARETEGANSKIENTLKSFLLEQLMFYKPYGGIQYYKPENTEKHKCFADECEWRYVPDVRKIHLQQLYYSSTIQKRALDKLSDGMDMNREVSLDFEYDDLKYIILNCEADFKRVEDAIINLHCEDSEKNKLFSKIVVWENGKGDF